MFEGISKGRLALGAVTVASAIGTFVLEQKEAKEAAEKCEKWTKEQAYKGGCDYAKEWYAKKGNPNAKRNQAKKKNK